MGAAEPAVRGIGTPQESSLPQAIVPAPIRERLGGYVAAFQRKDFFKFVDSSATYPLEGSYAREMRRWSDRLHQLLPSFDRGAKGAPLAAYADRVSAYWWAASDGNEVIVAHLRGEEFANALPGKFMAFAVMVPSGRLPAADNTAGRDRSAFIENTRGLLAESAAGNAEVRQANDKDILQEASPVVIRFLQANNMCPGGDPALIDLCFY